MFRPATTPPHFVTLAVLSWAAVLSAHLFVPSLARMAADFQVDYAVIGMTVAGYLAVTSVLQVFLGPLSDRVGRRPVLLVSVGVFALASLVCTVAEDIWVFLAFRTVQAGVIAGWTVSLAVIRDVSSQNEAASRIAYVTTVMALAPMVGPMVGGLLDETFGWRASFAVLTGLGVLAFGLCWADLGETNRSKTASVRSQLASYPELLSSRSFWTYAGCMAFSLSAFYAFQAGAPLVAATVLGLSPLELGGYLGSITVGFIIGSFISARLSKRRSLATMIVLGRLIAVFGLTTGLGIVAFGVVTPVTLFGTTIFLGLGNGFTMPSSSAGVMSIRTDLAGSASGLSGALAIGVSAIVSAVTGVAVSAGIPADAGPAVLLAIMLSCALLGLACGVDILRRTR